MQPYSQNISLKAFEGMVARKWFLVWSVSTMILTLHMHIPVDNLESKRFFATPERITRSIFLYCRRDF